jgi:hypothetical protein
MLIKNMDGNLVVNGNSFYETLKGGSIVFNNQLETSTASRKGSNKSTSFIRPVTSSSIKGGRTQRISFNNIPTITHHQASNSDGEDDDKQVNVIK